MSELEKVKAERDALVVHVDYLMSFFDQAERHAMRQSPTTSLSLLIKGLADKLEEAEGPDADSGYMWDASECAEWLREQARQQSEEKDHD